MAPADITFASVNPARAREWALRQQLLELWVRVTDAGGAVGFVAPADRELIAAALDEQLERVATGRDRLGVIRHDGGRLGPPPDGEAVGMGVLAASRSPLRAHWRTVLRLMVDPPLQGQGAGTILLEGLHGLARDQLGLEFVSLSVRSGLGIEGFYARHGYTETGRNPRSIRVGRGDERDEIFMRRVL